MTETASSPPIPPQDKSPRYQVAIAGGGTAGHVTSGIAIMLAFREMADIDVYFIGCRGGFESDLVPSRGFDLEVIPGAPFERQGRWGKLRAGAELLRGIGAARRVLATRRTRLVIGLGGYASAGAVIAARMLGIHTAIHEANVDLGRANRLVRRFADQVFLGWPQTAGVLRGTATSVTGNPILPEMSVGLEASVSLEGRHRIVVTGGSTGSPFLNRNAPDLLAAVRALGLEICVLHQCGNSDPAPIRERYAAAKIAADVCPYVKEWAEAYRDAQFAISAAGALTLSELANLGLPSLLVPIRDVAHDHQTTNAAAFAEATGSMWVAEGEWDGRAIAGKVAEFLRSPERVEAQRMRLREFARPGAAREIVRICSQVLR